MNMNATDKYSKDNHSSQSSLREQYIEYAFLGDLCREMWRRGIEMDILRSHTDRSGYDILLDANGIERHVQLKSSFVGAKTSRQNINSKLADKPSGCVIWIFFDRTTMAFTKFRWFGAEPGKPLPDLGEKIAKHSKGDAQGAKSERQGIRVLNKGGFDSVDDVRTLAELLFGCPRSKA